MIKRALSLTSLGAAAATLSIATAPASLQARPAGSVHRTGTVHRSGTVNHHTTVHHHHNVDVDVHHHGYHPVARAAVTAAVVGTYYRTLPANCVKVYRSAVVYYHCGTTWYQPVPGATVQYVVVKTP